MLHGKPAGSESTRRRRRRNLTVRRCSRKYPHLDLACRHPFDVAWTLELTGITSERFLLLITAALTPSAPTSDTRRKTTRLLSTDRLSPSSSKVTRGCSDIASVSAAERRRGGCVSLRECVCCSSRWTAPFRKARHSELMLKLSAAVGIVFHRGGADTLTPTKQAARGIARFLAVVRPTPQTMGHKRWSWDFFSSGE